jgi:hypothetical protein
VQISSLQMMTSIRFFKELNKVARFSITSKRLSFMLWPVRSLSLCLSYYWSFQESQFLSSPCWSMRLLILSRQYPMFIKREK